jgi:hypothetical protein
MTRVFIRFDDDDLLHELERQGFPPVERMTLDQHRRLETLFAEKLAGSTVWEIIGDLAGDAALQVGLTADDASAEPDAPLPGDVAGRDTL